MNEIESHISLGLSHIGAGRPVEALAAFNEVLALQPDNAEALFNAGKLHIAQKSPDTAIDLLSRAVEVRPGDAEPRYFLGIAYVQVGRFNEAVGCFETAVRLNDHFVEAYNALGAALFTLGRMAESSHCFECAAVLNPADPQPQVHLGNIAFETADFEAALGFYRKALDIDGNLPGVYFDLGTALEKLDRLEDATDAFRNAIARDPTHVDSMKQLAAVQIRQADYENAEEMLRRCLAIDENDGGTHMLMGSSAFARGGHEAAVESFRAAIEAGLVEADVFNDLGAALQKLEEHEQAIQAFQAALRLAPRHGAAHNNLGQSLMILERLEEALAASLIATEIDPGSTAFLRSKGVILGKLNRPAEAIECLERSLEAEPNSVVGLKSLATVYSIIGNFEKSNEILLKGIDLKPDDAELRRRLAFNMMEMGSVQDAIDQAALLVELHPGDAEALVTRAFILSYGGHPVEAFESIERGLALHPDHFDALQVRVRILESLKKHGEALKTLMRMMELRPKSTSVVGQIVNLVLTLCEWDRASAFTKTLVDTIRAKVDSSQPIGVCINNLQALPLDYAFLVEAARNVAAEQYRKAEVDKFGGQYRHPPAEQRRERGGRIRLGYLLPYVHFHSLPLILKKIVESHDRNRFEVIGYCTGLPSDSEFTEAYCAAFDTFKFIGSQPLAAARDINADGVDILIDVAGQTLMHCMEVLAFRPAPLCIHYLGYSISTGADFVDYLVTDEIYIPPEDMEPAPEQPIYLPPAFLATSQPPISTDPVSREVEGLPADGFVFCNFNQPFKLEPEIFGIWMKILSRVPGSVLWLGGWSQEAEENLRDSATSLGISDDRLIFGVIKLHSVHLKRLSLADLALDSHHHGGGVTTIDCLWAGLPVLCVPGGTPSARLGRSILEAADLVELLADNVEEYEEKAVAFATNSGRLNEIREDWWGRRAESRLFDSERYMRHLENGIELAWQNYLDGNPPRALYVEDNSEDLNAGAK